MKRSLRFIAMLLMFACLLTCLLACDMGKKPGPENNGGDNKGDPTDSGGDDAQTTPYVRDPSLPETMDLTV